MEVNKSACGRRADHANIPHMVSAKQQMDTSGSKPSVEGTDSLEPSREGSALHEAVIQLRSASGEKKCLKEDSVRPENLELELNAPSDLPEVGNDVKDRAKRSEKKPARVPMPTPLLPENIEETGHVTAAANGVENNDPLFGSTSDTSGTDGPPSHIDFNNFLKNMRRQQAEPIGRYVKSFLLEFGRRTWTPTEQEKIVADFRIFIAGKMDDCLPFSKMNTKDRAAADEGMEKLLMNRLYTRTFPPKIIPMLRADGHEEDLLRDRIFEEKMRIWGWIEGHHLDINEEYLESCKSFIQLACDELSKINQFRAPRDKMICVLNCSKVLWAIIRQARLQQNADSFLPLLIFVLLRAQPPHLISNIRYIQRFRNPKFMSGENGYYLSTFSSAAAFIEGLDRSVLTISDEEYDKNITAAVKAEAAHKQQLEEEMQKEASVSRNAADEYPSSVLAASAGMLVEQLKSFTSRMLTDETEHSEHLGQRHPPVDMSRSAFLAAEEEAALQASAEEYAAQNLRQQEFARVAHTLHSMFPNLDREIIDDVLYEKSNQIGEAVDVCLALTN